MPCMVVLVFLLIQFMRELIREYVVITPPTSSISFWQDNRTYQTGQSVPLPTTTIEQINLTNLTIIMTACCRNVEKHLVGFKKNVHAIGELFRNYRLYLGESDSTDNTLKIIQEWAKNDPNHFNVYSAGQQRWRQFFRKHKILLSDTLSSCTVIVLKYISYSLYTSS